MTTGHRKRRVASVARVVTWAAVVVALVVPFVAALALTRWATPALATALAAPLADAATVVDRLEARGEPQPRPEGAEEYDGLAVAELSSNLATPAQARPAQPPIAGGVLVRAKRVQALARVGVRPSGSPVPATAERPAGVALHGVSALGVGLHDGDVLTRVGGTPATSEGRVVAAVHGALRSGARALSGEVWRGSQRFVVTVELPHDPIARAP